MVCVWVQPELPPTAPVRRIQLGFCELQLFQRHNGAFFISPALCAGRWIPSLAALGNAKGTISPSSQYFCRWEEVGARTSCFLQQAKARTISCLTQMLCCRHPVRPARSPENYTLTFLQLETHFPALRVIKSRSIKQVSSIVLQPCMQRWP